MEPLSVSASIESRQREKLRLRSRDFKILEHIAKYRWAPLHEIRDVFWRNAGTRNHYRRLSTLQRFDLIAPLKGDRSMLLGYFLTKKGAALLKSRGLTINRSRGGRPMFKTTFDHDRMLRRLRAIFESSPVVSDYLDEAAIRSMLAKRHGTWKESQSGYKVPDGYFELKIPNGKLKIYLELEIAAKSKARYVEMLRRLSDSRDLDSVFFVVARPKLLKHLRNELEYQRKSDKLGGGPNERGFYFILLDDLLKDGLDAKFCGEGTTFSLAELAKDAASEAAS